MESAHLNQAAPVRPLRLAICSTGELFGGVETQILDLCRLLTRRGCAPRLVTLFFDHELARRLRTLGIEPVILRGAHRYDPRLARRLADELRSHDIQVVHAHGYKATIACALARRWYSFGLIKTEHGLVEGSLRQPWAWLRSRANHALDSWATRRVADRVCYVTDDIRRHYDAAHAGLDRHTVHNGIDPLEASSYPRPEDLPADRFQVGIVGRVTGVKGIPFALQALAGGEPDDRDSDGEALAKDERPLCLNIIGSGPATPALEGEALRLGVADRVRFLGFRRNILDYIAHLDALLMPSLHEGLPYVLLEAMALGRPVLASRVGGLAEVLEDEESGLLCAVGDVAGLRQALRRVMAEPDLRAKLGQGALAEQRQRYTLDRMGEAYLKFYREVRPQ